MKKGRFLLIPALAVFLSASPVCAVEDAELWEKIMSGRETVAAFIGEEFYDGTIEDEDDALDAIYSVMEELGGDDSIMLEPDDVTSNAEGATYYTFRQVIEDVSVYGASVKLIVSPEGTASAVVSTLLPGIQAEPDYTWGIEDTEAEEIVRQQCKDDAGVKVYAGLTHQTLLPFEDEPDHFYYAWVVYTNNTAANADTAYRAHYVDESGVYLYSIPVLNPENLDALSGAGASFVFTGMEKETFSQEVTYHDGRTEELTFPVMRDTETGTVYLGDVDRQIICADYLDFSTDYTITGRSAEDGAFDEKEVVIYNNFLKIYDFFEETGWHGPDGEGSPVMILMDWVDEEGNPAENACYAGKINGFQIFQFDREENFGECVDVMAHEFAHCLTGKMMVNNLYLNDYGAINEAMSDIFGNLVESMLGETTDETWLVGETGGEAARCMSDPHQYEQPEFILDQYYVPNAAAGTDNNDDGGVHSNSSLLNLIAYRLHENGMPEEEELYFWMNVALALVPRTDYAQMAELLPWCMEFTGYTEYLDILEDAIAEVCIAEDAELEDIPEGCGMIVSFLPEDFGEDQEVQVSFISMETDAEFVTWPEGESGIVFATLPSGYYAAVLYLLDQDGELSGAWYGSPDGWISEEEYDEADAENCFLILEEGDLLEIVFDE